MGEYKKRLLLGKGATAQVYLAEEVKSGKRFAMKVSENRELLKREAEVLQALKGGYFPEFVEYLSQEGALVMEYLEGQDLQSLLNRESDLKLGEAVYIIGEVLQALDVLHEHTPPMIYRDIKPANIMLCPDGEIKLVDMGTVCLEEDAGGNGKEASKKVTVARAGTYGYGAPEQFWEGAGYNRSCDIYSVGKLFAYLLTGRNPAEPPYETEYFLRGLNGKAVVFRPILERSLAFSPTARYESVTEMWRAIQLAYEHSGGNRGRMKRQKSMRIYEKCIWKSEYRRIF